MSQTKVASFEDLKNRVHARVQAEREKQASAADQGIAVPTEKDPNDKGTVSAPSGEQLAGNDKKKLTVPANDKSNKDGGEGGKTLENAEAGTYGSGEGKPTPAAQDPKDEPTGDDLFSKKAHDIVSALKARMNFGKQAYGKPEEASADEVAADMDGFTRDFHVKLASHLLASEAGCDTVRQILSDSMTADAVDTLIKRAAEMEEQATEQQQVVDFVKQAMEHMDEDERKAFIESANFHYCEVESLGSALEKRAYQQGAMDAASVEAAGGQLPPIPAEGEAPSIEEVVMILEQLVQSGQIDPQMAQAILEELLGGAGGGDPMAAGALPPEAMKAASYKNSIDSLIDEVVGA